MVYPALAAGLWGQAGESLILPQLPYGYADLEPMLSERGLRAHHEHHGRVVRLGNRMAETLRAAVARGDRPVARALSRLVTFCRSSHALHSLFWRSIGRRTGHPWGDLARAMERTYGSVRQAREYFAEFAKALDARGWAVLAFSHERDKLVIFHTGEFVNMAAWPVTPLLVLDLWEHACQSECGDDRLQWIDIFMRMANWEFAAERYAAAREELRGAA